MGESSSSSACLVRSFSQPAGPSGEYKEGDPLCAALTTSVSFGRFMSESLAWEKWSSFSHNRYLEEAAKSSKPGSVAEKKAYFEAHYKRIAAKKAAALLEQQNEASNNDDTVDESDNNYSVVSELPKSDSHVVVDEIPGKEAPKTELVISVDASVSDVNVERINLETDKVEETEQVAEELGIAENSIQAELSKKHENVEKHKKLMATQQQEMFVMDAAKLVNSASASKKKQSAVGSSKLSTHSGGSKLRSSVKSSPVQLQKEDNATQTSKKTARESAGKKRSTPKLLQMSINFPSHAGETSKTSSPIIQKIGNSKIIRAFVKTSKDCSKSPLQNPTRASVNGLAVHPSANPQPQTRRNKLLQDCSVSMKRAADIKTQSLSLDHSESSSASGHKARSPTVVSSFNFRCEERVAKRKEFFQKLEERRLNLMEAEKMQLRAKTKEKSGEELKNMRQSISFKAKAVANSHHETASPNSRMKIPLTRPRSPKLGRRPSKVQDTGSKPPHRPSVHDSQHNVEKSIRTPNQKVQDIDSQPPRWPSVNGSKKNMEKSIHNPTRSINSTLRKSSMLENTSPNIQFLV